jgi:hypothetical protein
MSKTFAGVMADTLKRLGIDANCSKWKDVDAINAEFNADLATLEVEMIPGVWVWDDAMEKSIGYDFQFLHYRDRKQDVNGLCQGGDAVWFKRAKIQTVIRDTK